VFYAVEISEKSKYNVSRYVFLEESESVLMSSYIGIYGSGCCSFQSFPISVCVLMYVE